MRAKVWMVPVLVGLLAAIVPSWAFASGATFASPGEAQMFLSQGWLNAADDIGQQLESQYGVCDDSALNQWLDRIQAQMNLVAPKMYPGKDKRVRSKILDNADFNACALTDGRTFVFRGAMEKLKNKPDSDAHLAALLGHEMAHVYLNHGLKSMSWATGAAVLLKYGAKANDTITEIGSAVLTSGKSKEYEYTADANGVQHAYLAGYGAHQAVGLYRTLAELHPSDTPWPLTWVASHPDSRKRIENATRRADQLGEANSINISNYESSTPPVTVRLAVNVRDQYRGGGAFWGNEPSEERVRSEMQDALLRQGANWVEVLDRESREEAWEEQDQGDTGRMDPSTVPAKGKTRGASHFLYIDLNYYTVTQLGEVGIGSWSGGARARLVKAELKGKARLTSVETSSNIFSIQMYGSEKGQDVEAERNDRGLDARGSWSSRPAGKALSSACDQVAREIIARLGGRRPTAQTISASTSIARPRPVEVEQSHEFMLTIRPKNAADSRKVVARFEATLAEVMTNNRIHFFRGNMVVATVEIDYTKSRPESFTLEGTLWAPAWENLSLTGVTTCKLTTR